MRRTELQITVLQRLGIGQYVFPAIAVIVRAHNREIIVLGNGFRQLYSYRNRFAERMLASVRHKLYRREKVARSVLSRYLVFIGYTDTHVYGFFKGSGRNYNFNAVPFRVADCLFRFG